jgi:hypothetical protein
VAPTGYLLPTHSFEVSATPKMVHLETVLRNLELHGRIVATRRSANPNSPEVLGLYRKRAD